MKALLLTCWFVVQLLLPFSAQAADSSDAELINLRQQLNALGSEDRSLDKLRNLYKQAISAAESGRQFNQQAIERRQQIEQQADKLRAFKELLATPQPKPLAESYSQQSRELLERERNLTKAELLSLEAETAQLQKQIDQFSNKQVNLRKQLADLRQQQNQPISNAEKEDPSITPETRQQLDNAQFNARLAQLQALELELLALPGERELNTIELEIKQNQILLQSARLNLIEAAIQQKRRQDAEQAISQTELNRQDSQSLHPVLQRLQQQNQQLREELRATIAANENTSQASAQLNQQLIKLGGNYRTIQQQLELDIGYVSGELRRLMLKLSQPIDTRSTLRRINAERLRSLELNEQMQLLLATEPNSSEVNDFTTAQQQRYLDLLHDQKKLSDQLRSARQQHIGELSQLLATQQQFNTQIQQSLTLLDRHLLWVPSVPAINSLWFADISQDLSAFVNRLVEMTEQPIFSWRKRFAATLLVGMLLILISNLLLRYKRRHQPDWQQQIGKVKQDRISHTLGLLALAPIIALPIPYLLWSASNYALNIDHPDHRLFNDYLKIVAVLCWIAQTLHIWLRVPDGMFNGHFGVPHVVAQLLRKRIVPTLLISIPLLFCAIAADQIDHGNLRSGLGRVLFVGISLLIILFWLNLWKVSSALNELARRDSWWTRSKIWLSLLIIFQSIMTVSALAGYLFTAGVLTLSLLAAISVSFLVFTLYRLGRRWLLIEERKLAFSRALNRRAEMLAARENKEDEPPIKEDYLDLQTISDQSLMLLKTITVAFWFMLLWLTLGDLLPSLDVLDSVQLWSSSISTSEGTVLDSISIQDLLFSSLLLGVCLLAAYNLPGLLELLILRHLPLAPGSSYAITTLVKYVLVLVGILSGFSQLGVAWDKLQWLVAALGVGLGFGLQEIVANFVSGLIILFEKPVRIGDTVTIRGLTGTVTRIQIRATTISDWDRKEVVIPNKTFITEQLINWSLSDAVTRVVIPFSVRLGADAALVRSILLEVARKNDRVLDDPPSEAFFIEFGERAMKFEMRVYVASMIDRLEVTHELNSSITDALAAENIELARPQLDVHLNQSAQI